MNRNECPIVYTIIKEADGFRIFTKDARIAPGDACISGIANSKLFATMVMISTILNNEGYGLGVVFEVD